jgi:copper resistance protein B
MSAISQALAFALAVGCTRGFAAGEAAPSHEATHATASASSADASVTEETTTASTHVPPAPPQSTMPEMDARAMIDAMQMDDGATFASVRLDRFERVVGGDGNADGAWKIESTLGRDFDKFALRSEGVIADGAIEEGDVELLWRHAAAAFWDTTLGVRRDIGQGASRSWLAFGVQGLAPYWIDVEATAYVGDAGRTAFRLELDHDVRLTQRLVVQPRVELDAYGRDDARARVGAGVESATLALQLRYELTRGFAPYVGVERVNRYGIAADSARADGLGARETLWVAGVRLRY